MTTKASITATSDRAKREADRKLWPFHLRHSMLWVILLLIGLLLGIAILRFYFAWPSDSAENAVLTGVLVLSLLLIVLPLLDIMIERGGVIEYGGVKIDFSQLRSMGIPSITRVVEQMPSGA